MPRSLHHHSLDGFCNHRDRLWGAGGGGDTETQRQAHVWPRRVLDKRVLNEQPAVEGHPVSDAKMVAPEAWEGG